MKILKLRRRKGRRQVRRRPYRANRIKSAGLAGTQGARPRAGSSTNIAKMCYYSCHTTNMSATAAAKNSTKMALLTSRPTPTTSRASPKQGTQDLVHKNDMYL